DQHELHNGHREGGRRGEPVVLAEQRHGHRAEQWQQDQCEQPGHPNLTNNRAPTIRNVPPSIDSAYERTKPVCMRRRRPELPPNCAASPLTAPSKPRLSKNTANRVSHRLGVVTSASLSALP